MLELLVKRALEIFWSTRGREEEVGGWTPMTEQQAVFDLIDEIKLPLPQLFAIIASQATTRVADISPVTKIQLVESLQEDNVVSSWEDLLLDLIVAVIEAEMNKRDPRCDEEANNR